MNSGKIVADGWTDGKIEGSTRGSRGPKKFALGYVFQQNFVLGQMYLTKGHPFINDIIYNPLKRTKVSLNFELLF